MALRKTHKHAELIKAWADGAEIQVFDNIFNSWFDVIDNKPSWDFEHEYRIKPERVPEPKPDVVMEYLVDDMGTILLTHKNPQLKLTFDGETGELKSAEVLK